MKMDLQDKQILITREQSQAQSFSRLITEAGGRPIVVPLLEINCVTQAGQWELDQTIERFDWVFFTSANGVACFFKKFAEVSCRIAVVGTKTEDRKSTRLNSSHVA